MSGLYRTGDLIVKNSGGSRYFRKIWAVVGSIVFMGGDSSTAADADKSTSINMYTTTVVMRDKWMPADREVEMTLEEVQELLGFKVSIKNEAKKASKKKEDL